MPKITDKKTGKVRRFRYTKGGHADYKRALREKIASIAPVVGAVGAQRAVFKRQGDTNDPTATAARGGSSTLAKATGFQTRAQKDAIRLKQRQQRVAGRGYTGDNPTARRVQTAAGIAASTEMDWTNKIVEKLNIKKAIKRPGALRRKDPTPNTPITGKDISTLKKSKNKRTRAQARFAQTLAKLRKR